MPKVMNKNVLWDEDGTEDENNDANHIFEEDNNNIDTNNYGSDNAG